MSRLRAALQCIQIEMCNWRSLNSRRERHEAAAAVRLETLGVQVDERFLYLLYLIHGVDGVSVPAVHNRSFN